MREFKFRAYVKEIEETFKVGKIDFENKLVRLKKDYGNKEYSFEEIELMQYTGLKDKNDEEICEGGILKGNNNPDDLVYVALEEFEVVDMETESVIDKVVGWHTKVIPTDALSKLLPFSLDMPLAQFYIDRAKWEIIGNIYENAELLKVK